METESGRVPRWLGVLVFLALLVVSLELTARMVVFGARGLDPRKVGLWSDLDPRDLVTLETDPAIQFQYRPNLDVWFKLVRFRTNSRGLRDREYPVRKDAGVYRVAVIGSSFTLPAGVAIEDAFHSRLEARLSAGSKGRAYEFLNFAVGLHGPSQMVAMLEKRALGYAPDLVLVSATRMAVPQLLLEWDRPPRADLLDALPRGPRSIFVEAARSRLGLDRHPIMLGRPGGPGRPPRGADVIERLGHIRRRTGIPIAVVRLEYDPTPATEAERVVERRCAKYGVGYVDTRAAFEGREPRDFWIYELDPHPNAAAHAIFADVIEDHLRTEGLLLEGSVSGLPPT